jgi:hypothetical protein
VNARCARDCKTAVVSAILICAGIPMALAQSYSASGQIGYLQEWEIKGDLARTTTRSGADYSGPVTLRHVGLCSTDGVEEKSGMVQLKVLSSRLEGTLAMDDDNCKIVASASSSYSGLLSCRNGQGVPIQFSIGEASPATKGSDRSPAK